MYSFVDRDLLLVIAGVLLTSRAWKGAVVGWIGDVITLWRWVRRRALDEIYVRLNSQDERVRELEVWSQEHDSDVDLHTARRQP